MYCLAASLSADAGAIFKKKSAEAGQKYFSGLSVSALAEMRETS